MNTFSIKRIFLLLKEYYTTHLKKDLLMLFVPFGLCVLVFLIGGGALIFYISIGFFLFWAFGSFSQLGKKDKATNYLILPASNLEKTIATLIRIYVFQTIFITIASLLGVIMGITIANWLQGNNFISGYNSYTIGEVFNILFSKYDFTDLMTIFTVSAMAVFASVYFKKRALPKFILFVIVLAIITAALDGAIVKFFLDDSKRTEFYLSMNQIDLFDSSPCIHSIISSIFILFLWFLTYLRLKETEVK
jgi:hypothetical protein